MSPKQIAVLLLLLLLCERASEYRIQAMKTTVTEISKEENFQKKKTDYKNMLIVYYPIDFCVIHSQNATSASNQLATTTNKRRLRTQQKIREPL